MWRFLSNSFKTRNAGAGRIQKHNDVEQISAIELAAFCWCASDRLMIFDLRDLAELEEYPHAIPGALLTTHVDVTALVSWIPENTIAVFYAAKDVPPRLSHLRAPSEQVKLYMLSGGLRSWWQSGLPVEDAILADWKSSGLK